MPEYLTDWTFWSFVVATNALLLSQLPPVKYWWQNANIAIDVYPRLSITHKVGNPNAQIHLILINSGGRPVRVTSVVAKFFRNGNPCFELPLETFLQEPQDQNATLFRPINFKPGDNWSHIANFLNFFTRDEERTFREMVSNLRSNIVQKGEHAEPNQRELIAADQEILTPILQFFREKFDWLQGEYHIDLVVTADKNSFKKGFDFTIFESDCNDLRSMADHYIHGAGIYWQNPDLISSIFIPLRESK